MLEILASPEYFPGVFAVLAAIYVSLKLAARHWPRKRRDWFGEPLWLSRARNGASLHQAQDVAGLLALAERAPTRDVQVAAIHSLGERKAREAIPLLGRLLSSADPVIATEAANSLGAIGDPAALTYLEMASTALEHELAQAEVSPPSPPPPARLQPPPPAQAPWEKIVPPLATNEFRVFDKYSPKDIKTRTEKQLVDTLLTMASNEEEPVATRYHAMKNLELYRDPSIVPKLRELLLDEHTTIRYAAAEVMAVHGDESCVNALVRALEDPNRFVRSSAAMTLAMLGSDKAVAPLLKLQNDPDDVVRYSVEKALGSLGKKRKIGSEKRVASSE